jgi:hypothetical protein
LRALQKKATKQYSISDHRGTKPVYGKVPGALEEIFNGKDRERLMKKSGSVFTTMG